MLLLKKKPARTKRRMKMLNFIQLGLGLAAAACVFIGLFTTIRSLDKNDSSKKISKETIIRSMVLITLGLLLYSGVKTCSNMMTDSAADYDIGVIYLASVVDVIKIFGFVIFIPLIMKITAPNARAKRETQED